MGPPDSHGFAVPEARRALRFFGSSVWQDALAGVVDTNHELEQVETKWPGSNRIVRSGVHIVPPERFGTGKFGVNLFKIVPELWRCYQMIRLFPEVYFAIFTIIPAITYNPMCFRSYTGKII